MRQAFRVLKPGGHMLVWALPRTSHWTATAIEDAGFEIRDRIHDLAAADLALANFLDSLTEPQQDALMRIMEAQGSPVLMHLFGTGYSKSMNVAKAFDKAAGIDPIEVRPASLGMASNPDYNPCKTQLIMPPPTTDDAKLWEGWGTCLKPAVEHWILARKPLEEENVILNVRKWGTAGLNTGACEIDVAGANGNDDGRQPPHLILQHSPGCQPPVCVASCPCPTIDAQSGVRQAGVAVQRNGGGQAIFGGIAGNTNTIGKRPDQTKGDKGGASRFYYQAKPKHHEKSRGAEHLQFGDHKPGNHHPTVKSTALMRWLCRLVCPPGGLIVDPFMGSGSTGVAALAEGFRFVGVERNRDGKGRSLGYFEVACARLAHAAPQYAEPLNHVVAAMRAAALADF
jgi:hypothetical protein